MHTKKKSFILEYMAEHRVVKCGKILVGALVKTWLQWGQRCSTHGIKFSMRPRGRNIFDRIFWLTIFTIAMIMACFALDAFLKRFKAFGMVNYIETHTYPVSQAEFPAITVCPTYKIYHSKFEQFVEEW